MVAPAGWERSVIETDSSITPVPAVSRSVKEAEASVWPVSDPQLVGGQGASTIGSGERVAESTAGMVAPSLPPQASRGRRPRLRQACHLMGTKVGVSATLVP